MTKLGIIILLTIIVVFLIMFIFSNNNSMTTDTSKLKTTINYSIITPQGVNLSDNLKQCIGEAYSIGKAEIDWNKAVVIRRAERAKIIKMLKELDSSYMNFPHCKELIIEEIQEMK